ncbi:type II toxin-antitoxin system HicB family antitoxin [bacterium]|nr:type II toxin-antitoxin system HicB family antitoxin [bacterium]
MPSTYTVVLREEPEGGYTVLVPALPEIVSYGQNLDEARRMASDAIQLTVEVRRERGEPTEETEPVIVPRDEYTADLRIYRLAVDLPEALPAHA